MAPGDMDGFSPQAEREAVQAAGWVAEHLALLSGAVAVVLLLGLALVVVALIAQGAMAKATAEVVSGQPSSFGHAWHVGLRLFWRYVGLWLSLAGAVVMAAALLAGVAAAAVAVAQVVEPGVSMLLVPIGLVLGAPLALLLLAGGVALSVVVTYAQRAIAVEDVGSLAALRSGRALLRAHVRESALLWLINGALAIGAGLAAGLLILVLAGVLMAVGMLLYAAVGMAAPTIGYAVLSSIALLTAMLLGLAIANTFFWSYWTLGYLRLSGRTPHLMAV
jgi:hypothetical protein